MLALRTPLKEAAFPVCHTFDLLVLVGILDVGSDIFKSEIPLLSHLIGILLLLLLPIDELK